MDNVIPVQTKREGCLSEGEDEEALCYDRAITDISDREGHAQVRQIALPSRGWDRTGGRTGCQERRIHSRSVSW
jgi:hypothetical protein